jgi:ATP-binding cassette subfamily B (MDR/TAP) protein 1
MEDDSKSELEPPARSATLAELFQYATFQDKVLMGVGTFAAIVTGACQPVSMIFFGKIIDGLNENDLDVQNTVNNIIFLFIGLAGLNVFTSLLQITCWTIAGERQVQRMRTLYVRSIFSQEIGWFDLNGASALSTQTADLLGKVQDGITRRAADMIMYAATFALCFVVALTISWRLALVLLCVVPLLAGAGYLMISAVTNAEKKSGEQYAKAGGLAIEMLKSVRTVTALNMQPDAIARYRVYIVEAMNIGVLKGLMVGVGTGLTFFVSYLTYALGFWYGTSLVADDIDDNCSRGCLTGGDVIATFFSIIIGATALGQVFAPLTAFFTAKSTVCSIIDVIDRKPLIDNVSDEGLKPKKCSGQIDLRDVHFAYPSRMDIMVCTGYNLTIKSGETVALCGASGCGKVSGNRYVCKDISFTS